MGYKEAYYTAWREGGPEAALALLKNIFHHPDNQRINGDATKTPAEGFDQMIRLFEAKQSIAERVDFILERMTESRSPADDLAHRVRPFNAFILRIGTYAHGDGGLQSVHVDFETGNWELQYGLNHEIIYSLDCYDPETDDDEYSFKFIHSLAHSNSYRLTYEGIDLARALLFRHIRMAQFSQLAAQIVDELLAREAFADFPKDMPFRFLVAPIECKSFSEGQLNPLLDFRAPLDETSLDGHALRDRYLYASAPGPELSPKENWSHLIQYLREPSSAEFAQLVSLLNEYPSLLESTRTLAFESLETMRTSSIDDAEDEPKYERQVRDRGVVVRVRGHREAPSPPNAFARLFWSLGDGENHRRLATEYRRHILELPLPELPRDDLEEAVKLAERALECLYGAEAEVPESLQERLEPSFEVVREQLRVAEHPVLRVLFLEREIALEHGEDFLVESPGKAPDDYVAALAACIEEVPKTFEGYGTEFGFVMDRLELLRQRAREVAPRVVQLMNDYCRELQGQGRRIDQVLDEFARVLMAMELEEPPPLLRNYAEGKAYDQSIEGYAKWVKRITSRDWKRLKKAFAGSPATYEQPGPWEEVLYDSEMGLELFAKRIVDFSKPMFDAVEHAAAGGPGPLLTKLVYRLADLVDTKPHEPAQPERAERIVNLLSAMPSLSDQYACMLRQTRLLRLRWAMDAGDAGIDDQISNLLNTYTDHPTLLFFRTQRTFARQGALAAGTEALAAITTLSAADLVYRKAFVQLTETTPPSFDAATVVEGYAAFRWADDHFKMEEYREGEFRGRVSVLDQDPFYRALAKRVAPWSDQERSAAKRKVLAELERGDP